MVNWSGQKVAYVSRPAPSAIPRRFVPPSRKAREDPRAKVVDGSSLVVADTGNANPERRLVMVFL
jgi:hypothetical protein